MKKLLITFMRSDAGSNLNNFALLFFRIAVSAELIAAHGLKKIGVGIACAEIVPNPLGLPEFFNQAFATGANLIMPLFIIMGFMTRIASLPILAVTLTGFFVLHFHDPILIRDVPFVYSVCFLLLFCIGPGSYSLDNYLTSKNKITISRKFWGSAIVLFFKF